MTRALKMVIALATALCLTAGCLAGSALASGEIDTSKSGSVTVNVPEDLQGDLAESTAAVNVYKLAGVNANGVFTPADRFAVLAENAQWNNGVLGAGTVLEDLADAAMAVIQPEPAEGAEEPALLEPDSVAEISVVNGQLSLEVGLYVLLPQKVETGQWVYTFSPMLLAVPSAKDAAWTYEVPVLLKPERELRLTEIVIDKTLTSYNASLGPTTFVFDVEAELNGANVYSNTVSLTFSGAGAQSVTVGGIPVGAHVTVTEAYSGASYIPADGRVSVEIAELPLPEDGNVTRVPFTNMYDEHLVPDVSVVNTFVFNGTGWQWTNQSEEG